MENQRLASFAVLLGGALWGLYWIPLRQIEAAGFQGSWPAASVFVFALLLAIPLLIKRRNSLQSRKADFAVVAILAGCALGFYTISLAYTDVIRATLLFYLTPIWSTLLGVFVLRERLTPGRIFALVLGLSGLAVVLGSGGSGTGYGDAIALASGVFWSLASLKIYRMPRAHSADLTAALITGCSLFTIGLTLLSAPLPSIEHLRSAIPWSLGTAVYLFPMMALTLWPATILTPARVGLLLLSEVLVGVSSAALFAREPFGLRELAGSLLIVTALLTEVLAKPDDG